MSENRNIIIIVVVLLALCCCCIAIGLSYQFGDRVFDFFNIDVGPIF